MNYGELKTAVENWLDHRDSNTQVETFIELARAEVNRQLRIREMTCTATTLGDGSTSEFDLPIDWGGARRITVDDQVAEYKAPDQFAASDLTSRMAAHPTYGSLQIIFTVIGSKLCIKGTPGDGITIQMLYYKKVPEFTDDNDTNWLLRDHPDCLLFGAVAEGHGYVMDEEREAKFRAKFMGVIESIRLMDWNDRWSGSPLRNRKDG